MADKFRENCGSPRPSADNVPHSFCVRIGDLSDQVFIHIDTICRSCVCVFLTNRPVRSVDVNLRSLSGRYISCVLDRVLLLVKQSASTMSSRLPNCPSSIAIRHNVLA
jgi:hypothetical protein